MDIDRCQALNYSDTLYYHTYVTEPTLPIVVSSLPIEDGFGPNDYPGNEDYRSATGTREISSPELGM